MNNQVFTEDLIASSPKTLGQVTLGNAVKLVSIAFQSSTDLHSRLQTFVVVAIVVAAELESIPYPLLEWIGNGFLGLRILSLIEGVIYWFCSSLSDTFCRVAGQLL